MEPTTLLSQAFGISLIIGGVAIWMRRSYFMPVVGAIIEEKLVRFVVSIIEMIAGIFVVLSHNVWGTPQEIIVSAIGWLLALEGIFYLLMPDRVVSGLIRAVNKPWWYSFGGIITIVIGVYLAGTGFGFF